MINAMIGFVTPSGDVDVVWQRDGEPVTVIGATVFPVGSHLSARWEHPRGITLSRDDAARIGLSVYSDQ